jgi:Protein of unknown function (DUF4012)
VLFGVWKAALLWALSLIASVVIALLSVTMVRPFFNGAQEFASKTRGEPPSSIQAKLARPLMWLATQHPGVEVTRYVPGMTWIERLGNDLDGLFAHGVDAASAGLNILEIHRQEPIFVGPGQLDEETLFKIQDPLISLDNSLAEMPSVIEISRNIPGWLVTKMMQTEFFIRAQEVESAARGAASGLRQGLDLILADSDVQVFLAVTNPAEKRGVQGIIGQYAVLKLTGGKIEKVSSGSNTSLVDPSSLPRGLSAEYRSLFGETNPEWVNMTLSPFADDAAVQMSAAWEQQSAEKVDVVLMMDTVALAKLVSSTSGSVTTPVGDRLASPEEISNYLSNGIYFDFPEDNISRKEFQSELQDGLVQHVLEQSFDLERVARSMFPHFGDGRIYLWFRDPHRQHAIAKTFVSGESASMRNGTIWVGANNFTGNKMDFYVQPVVTVRSCAGASRITIALTNTAARGASYPDYVTRRLDLEGGQNRLGVVLGLTVVVKSELGVRLKGWGQDRVSGQAFSLDGVPVFQETIELGLGQMSEFVVELKETVVDVHVSPFARELLNSVAPCS